jgi:flagellar export protein FliJ
MFVFRLERVLNFRKKVEEEIKREFSMKRAELLMIQLRIKAEMEKLKKFIRTNPLREGVFYAFELVALDNYISGSRSMIQRLRESEKAKEEEVTSALKEFTEAKKASKVLENLKQRRFEKYLEEELRRENNELDDVSQKISQNKEKLTIEDMPVEEM